MAACSPGQITHIELFSRQLERFGRESWSLIQNAELDTVVHRVDSQRELTALWGLIYGSGDYIHQSSFQQCWISNNSIQHIADRDNR